MLRLARTTGVRFNSTAANAQQAAAKAQQTAAKAQGTLVSLLEKGQGAVQGVWYWSRVVGELGKYVWVKEAMSPPTVQQVQKVFTQDLRNALLGLRSASKNPKNIVEQSSKVTKDSLVTGAAVVVQLLGFFSLGEIIGRRHIYGYKSYGEPEPHH